MTNLSYDIRCDKTYWKRSPNPNLPVDLKKINLTKSNGFGIIIFFHYNLIFFSTTSGVKRIRIDLLVRDWY